MTERDKGQKRQGTGVRLLSLLMEMDLRLRCNHSDSQTKMSGQTGAVQGESDSGGDQI